MDLRSRRFSLLLRTAGVAVMGLGLALIPQSGFVRAIPPPPTLNFQVNQVFAGPFPTNKQNEPSLAQNPLNHANLIAGSNDEIGEPACTNTSPSSCPFVAGVQTSGFYASFDGGQTWPCQGLINLAPYNEYSFGDPAQAFDSRGNAYYGGLAFPHPATTEQLATGLVADFFVAKSTDGGCSYPTAAKVNLNVPAQFDDKDAIAADSNASSPFRDNVYAVWTKFSGGKGFGNDQIFFSRSIDGGATFSAPLPLSAAHNNNAVGGRQGPAIAVGPDGSVYVTWFDTVQKTAVELFTASHDGGVTFSHPQVAAVVNDDFVSPLPGTSFRQGSRIFPSISVGGDGELYIGWSERVSGHSVMKVVHSTNDGATWSSPVTAGDVGVSQGRSAYFQSVAADPLVAGRVFAVFNAVTDLPTATPPGAAQAFFATYFAVSTNGGVSFGPSFPLSTNNSQDPDGSSTNSLGAQFLGDYITAISDGTHLYADWTDARNASTCAAVDAFRAGTGPKPNVITQCPTTFGNTDIFIGILNT